MRVVDPSTPPVTTGRYRYIDPETKQTFEHPYLISLRQQALVHRRANNLPIPTNWDQFFESNVCENTATANCEPEETSLRGAFHLARQFAKEMANWSMSGFDVVSKDVLKERHEICHACPYWNGSALFGTGRCGHCGCSGIKLYLATTSCPDGRWGVKK